MNIELKETVIFTLMVSLGDYVETIQVTEDFKNKMTCAATKNLIEKISLGYFDKLTAIKIIRTIFPEFGLAVAKGFVESIQADPKYNDHTRVLSIIDTMS